MNKSIKTFRFLILGIFVFVVSDLASQNINLNGNSVEAINVFMTSQKIDGEDVIKVIKDSLVTEFDEPTFVKISNLDFTNGTIEVEVLSRLLEDAPDFSRGFIGVAFRINDDNSMFESIYLRPTNARADNQVRRNHSIQYFAYPDYKYERLRKESPELYESYTDMALNEWTTMRIVVRDNTAKLFINNNKQPSLIVEDLKYGSNVRGAIGLWVDVGTEGFFKNLKINEDRF